MMDKTLEQWLAGRRERQVSLKGETCLLRVTSALEVLEARREADELAAGAEERALCSNACLLARALWRDGERVFQDGRAALAALAPGEIGRLATELGQLNEAENPSPEEPWEASEARKKAWSTRPMSGSSGACSGNFTPCPAKTGSGE